MLPYQANFICIYSIIGTGLHSWGRDGNFGLLEKLALTHRILPMLLIVTLVWLTGIIPHVKNLPFIRYEIVVPYQTNNIVFKLFFINQDRIQTGHSSSYVWTEAAYHLQSLVFSYP